MNSPWVVFCGGRALPNPGRIGLGAVLQAPDGTQHTLSVATHLTGCNNEAELRALMAALRELQRLGATSLQLHTDSRVVADQLGGEARPAMPQPKPIARLSALFDEARALLGSFDQVRLSWVPQHRNAQADALARSALGLPPRPLPTPSRRRP